MNPLRYLQLAFVLLVLGAGGYFAWSYNSMAKRIATAEGRIGQAEADAEALRRDYETLSQEIVRRTEVDRLIREARTATNIRLDEVQHEDPVARPYLREPIPDSVRRAYLDDQAER